MEERIKEIIEEMSTEDKIALWNEYCDSANRFDDWIEVEKSTFYIDELVDYIIENEEDFGNDEIAEVLEGEEEEEEE